MSRYTFMMNHDDGTMISVSGNKETATEVLEDFKTFLLGVGYHHNTVEDIIMEDTSHGYISGN